MCCPHTAQYCMQCTHTHTYSGGLSLCLRCPGFRCCLLLAVRCSNTSVLRRCTEERNADMRLLESANIIRSVTTHQCVIAAQCGEA